MVKPFAIRLQPCNLFVCDEQQFARPYRVMVVPNAGVIQRRALINQRSPPSGLTYASRSCTLPALIDFISVPVAPTRPPWSPGRSNHIGLAIHRYRFVLLFSGILKPTFTMYSLPALHSRKPPLCHIKRLCYNSTVLTMAVRGCERRTGGAYD